MGAVKGIMTEQPDTSARRRKQKISHTLDAELLEYLHALSEREGITRSQVLNRLVRDRFLLDQRDRRPVLLDLAPARAKTTA